MSSTDNLNVNIEELAADAGKAGITAAASVPRVVVPPPDAVSSELDAAAVSVAEAIKGLLARVNGNDQAAAEKQATMFAESPPVLQQQDTQAAGDYGKSTSLIPEVKPPVGAPDTGIVRSVGYNPGGLPEGPWGLGDDEWELDEFGSPQPIWPHGGGGGSASGGNAGLGTAPI